LPKIFPEEWNTDQQLSLLVASKDPDPRTDPERSTKKKGNPIPRGKTGKGFFPPEKKKRKKKNKSVEP
jgi:hypothetical protein